MHTVMLGRMLFIHKTLGGLKLLMLGPFCLVHLKRSSYNIFGYNSSEDGDKYHRTKFSSNTCRGEKYVITRQT